MKKLHVNEWNNQQQQNKNKKTKNKTVLKMETANEGNEYQIVSALWVLWREKCKFD